MSKQALISFNSTVKYLGLGSRDALMALIKQSDAPKPIKLGTTRQAPVFFIIQELDDWIELQKSKRPSTPNQYGLTVSKTTEG